jgi:hypothetical protein
MKPGQKQWKKSAPFYGKIRENYSVQVTSPVYASTITTGTFGDVLRGMACRANSREAKLAAGGEDDPWSPILPPGNSLLLLALIEIAVRGAIDTHMARGIGAFVSRAIDTSIDVDRTANGILVCLYNCVE